MTKPALHVWQYGLTIGLDESGDPVSETEPVNVIIITSSACYFFLLRIGADLCLVTLHGSFSLLLENPKILTTYSAEACRSMPQHTARIGWDYRCRLPSESSQHSLTQISQCWAHTQKHTHRTAVPGPVSVHWGLLILKFIMPQVTCKADRGPGMHMWVSDWRPSFWEGSLRRHPATPRPRRSTTRLKPSCTMPRAPQGRPPQKGGPVLRPRGQNCTANKSSK